MNHKIQYYYINEMGVESSLEEEVSRTHMHGPFNVAKAKVQAMKLLGYTNISVGITYADEKKGLF